MKTTAKEIVIAGAGPAGMAASIVLAQAGYQVSIHEQRSGVGGRFNDDYQGLENWSRTEDVLAEIARSGIEPNWWHKPFHGGILYDPNLRPMKVTSPTPMFYMVRRGADHPDSLDLALERQAQAAGVDFIFNSRLDPDQANILATGPRRDVAVIASGITFPIDRPDFAAGILNDELAPAGYVYFLIADKQATLATVLFERFKDVHVCMDRSMETVKRLFDIPEFPAVKRWGGYGTFKVPKSCESNGAPIIGEAAGFQDLLFGFGIRNALISGALAAHSIIEGQSYDALWRAHLLPHLQASAVNRALYSKFGFAKKWFWLAAGKNNQPNHFLHWLYNFSPVHKIIYPFITPNK